MTFTPGTFDTEDHFDIETTLSKNFNAWERGNLYVDQQTQEQDQRKLELQLKEMNQLLEITDKVLPMIENKAAERVKNERVKGAIFAQENSSNDSDESRALLTAQDKVEEAALRNETANQKARNELEARNVSIFAREEFKKLSPYARNQAIASHAMKNTAMFEANWPDVSNYSTIQEYNATVKSHKEKYMRSMIGLGDDNKKFMEKYVHRPMRMVAAKKFREFELQVTNRARKEDLAQRYSDFYVKLNAVDAHKKGLAPLIQEVVGTTAVAHFKGNKARALAEVREYLGNLADKGDLDLDLVDTLKSKKKGMIKHSSSDKELLFSEINKPFYDDIRGRVIAYNKQLYQEQLSIKQGQGAEVVQTVQDTVNNGGPYMIPNPDGKGMIETDIVSYTEYQQKAYKKITGNESHVLKEINAANNPKLINDERTRDYFNKKYELGRLSMVDLDPRKVSHTIINEFKAKAKEQDQARQATSLSQPTFQNKAKSLMSKVIVAGRESDSYIAFGDMAFAMYERDVVKLKAMNPDMAPKDVEAMAMERTMTWMEEKAKLKGKGNFNSIYGFDMSILHKQYTKDNPPTIIDKNLDDWEELRQIDTAIGSLKFEALTTPLESEDGEVMTIGGSKSDLERFSEGYGQADWKPSGALLHLSKRFGTDPTTILNTLRETAGLPKLKSDFTHLQLNSIGDWEKKRLLTDFPDNDDIKAAATWKVIDPNPDVDGDEFIREIVPFHNNYSEAIKDYESVTGEGFEEGDADQLIPYMAFADEVMRKHGYSKEELLEENSYANQLLWKKMLGACVDPNIKSNILNTHLTRTGIKLPDIQK